MMRSQIQNLVPERPLGAHLSECLVSVVRKTLLILPIRLRRWWPTYLIGTLYERIVSSTRLFEPFRVVLIAEFRKPE